MIKPWLCMGLCALVVTCTDDKRVSRPRTHVARHGHVAKAAPSPTPTPVIIEHEGTIYKLK